MAEILRTSDVVRLGATYAVFVRCIVHQTLQENDKSRIYKRIDLKWDQVCGDV